MESPDKPPEKREALAGLHTYDPVPTDKIFPLWESILKFGWIGALVVAGAVGFRFWKPEVVKPVVPVLHFAPASQWSSESGFNLGPAMSRDGKLVAYASDRQGNGSLQIWMRPFDSDKPVRLTDGEFNETDPDFSPDGRMIAYRSERDGGGVYVHPTSPGGTPTLIAKAGWKPKFSPDGKWIAFFTLTGSEDVSATLGQGEIFIVPAEGGTPRRIQPSFSYARYPIWSPDGSHLLFTGVNKDGVRDWFVSSIEGGEALRTHALEWLNRTLRAAGYPDQWQGDSVFFSGADENDSHIWAMTIPASTMQATGPPRRLTDGADQEQQIAAGPGGRLLYAGLHLSSEIYSLPIDANNATVRGKLQPLTHDAARAILPALSADGSKMVYISNKSGKRDIWVSDPNGKADEAVTAFRDIGYRPLLSADGKNLVFPVFENRRCLVALQSLSPPGPPELLKGCFSIWDWSPDGSSLLTFNPSLTKAVDLMKISSGDRQTVLSHPTGNLFDARFSPDGRSIAFAAGPTAALARVYIAPLRSSPPPEREWIAVDTQAAGDPAWSPDSSVLYFRSKRDGFHCIWSQKLGPGKQPVGAPTAILHLHSAGLGISFLKATELSVAVAKDRLTVDLGKTTGNIWTMTLPAEKPAPVKASSQSQ